MLNSLTDLFDEEKCYAYVRQSKGTQDLSCPACRGTDIRKNGHDKSSVHRQRYYCKSCRRTFTDLTDTVVSGNHIPLQKWVACDLMRRDLPRHRIARLLDLPDDTIDHMVEQLKSGLYKSGSGSRY